MSDATAAALIGDPAPGAAASADAGKADAGKADAGAGGAPFDWQGLLGPELWQQAKPTIEATKWQSPADLWRGYQEARAAIGADKLVLPGKDAKPEAWDPIWTKLGRPESPEKYDLAHPKDLPFDAELDKAFRATLHKAGVPQAHAKALYDWSIKALSESRARETETFKASEATARQALLGKWGDKAETQMAMAERAIQAMQISPAEIQQLRAAGLGSRMLEILARVGAGLAEGPSPGGAARRGALSPDAAAAAIDAFYADKDKMAAYKDMRHPAHKSALEEITALFDQANPAAA